MIFADKLIALRKKAGYSQEELAQQLNVTRQSVSKWEGAQSVPDIEKILQISKLFGVTTDYLLKDEMGEPEYAESEPTALRRVTLEQANAALAQAKVNAPYMAWGTALCVASPVMLLLLGEICQHSQFGLNENVATGIGLCVLLVMVCAAVVLFMLCGTKNRDFDFLEKEPFETEYGVTGMVRERQAAYRPTYDKLNLTGTVLCILSAIPLFVAMMVNSGIVMNAAVCVLLVLVACGVFAFVLGGTYYGATEKLLEEGDYTRHSKATRELRTAISVVYWLVVTAAFLLYTFGPKGNGQPVSNWGALALDWSRRQKRIDAEDRARGKPAASEVEAATFKPTRTPEQTRAELERRWREEYPGIDPAKVKAPRGTTADPVALKAYQDARRLLDARAACERRAS